MIRFDDRNSAAGDSSNDSFANFEAMPEPPHPQPFSPKGEKGETYWDRMLVVWLVVPALWLSVWVLACLLHAWDNTGADSTGIATLGWLPSLIAGLMTSLYLSSRALLRNQVSTVVVHLIAAVVVVVFSGTQVYLGGWSNGLLVLLVQIASEFQLLLQAWMSDNQTRCGDRLAIVDVPPATNTSNESRAAEPSSCASSSRSNDRNIHGDATTPDDPQTRNHVEAEEECEADVEAETDLTSLPWLQQMTRSNYEPTSRDEYLGDSAKLERVEWFYRHQWQPSEVQVELHCVFQPPFARKPRLQVQVVEGAGEVSIGDSLAHGARLQLKRQANGPDAYSVVWLEAIG